MTTAHHPNHLQVRTKGANRARPVVFLHGFMGSADDWSGVMAALAETCFCVAVDLPGHGRSIHRPDHAYTFSGTARALADVLDRNGLPRCTLVGYSMGGRIALYAALNAPDRFTRLVLESASPGLRTKAERAERRRLDEARADRLTADFDAFLDAWYRMPLFETLQGGPDRLESMKARRRRNDPAELAKALHGLGTGRQPSLWPHLPGLQAPTLVLAGEHDPKYVALAREMSSLSDRIHLDLVPAAGHNIHLEAPEAYIRLLHRFLTR